MNSNSICILQSYDEKRMTPWLEGCRCSVQAWANSQGYDYLFIENELFDEVPDWYMHKVADKLPVASDLGRLQWILKLHQQYEAVVWLDIDVLVFEPEHLSVDFQGRDCIFGQELWLQINDSHLKTYRNVHNAYMGFRQGSSTLPFLIDTVTRLVKDVDEAYIAPQFVGPKLLGSLHNTVGFALEGRVGALSDVWVEKYLSHDEASLEMYQQQLKVPMYAANLCLSLHADDGGEMETLVESLLTMGFGKTESEMDR